MDKQQIIAFIEGQLATGRITKADLLEFIGSDPTLQSGFVPVSAGAEPIKEENSKNVIHTFYGIGVITAIIGVGILIIQNWNEIGFGGRVLVTLGISLVAYILGLILRSPGQRTLSQVMFTISAALAPLAPYVLLREADMDFSWSVQLMASIALMVVFGVAFLISKKNILVPIIIGFASWAYLSFVVKVLSVGGFEDLRWASMLLGASYLFISYSYRSLSQPTDAQDEKEKRSIQNVLHGSGTLAILGPGIFIGGAFDLIFIAFIFGAFYGSVYFKSRFMLALGALFLIAHIIKLTSEYFVDSIGWPVALIGVGFLIIGIGYMTLYLNRRFLSVENNRLIV